MKFGIVFYVVVSLLTAMWIEQMDRTYLPPKFENPMAANLAVGVLWPFTLPLTMSIVALNKGRWHH